jgi:hypothetical protein
LRPRCNFVEGANRRVTPPCSLSRVNPSPYGLPLKNLRHWIFAILLTLVALRAGPVAAQQEAGVPASGPLPTIIYPSRTANPPPPELGPPAVAPEPACDGDDDCQVRYVLVGGAWGYWDRNRNFHRVAAATAHAFRSRAFAYRTASLVRGGNFGHDRTHR